MPRPPDSATFPPFQLLYRLNTGRLPSPPSLHPKLGPTLLSGAGVAAGACSPGCIAHGLSRLCRKLEGRWEAEGNYTIYCSQFYECTKQKPNH